MMQEVQTPFQSGSCDTAVFGGLSHSGRVSAHSSSPVKGQSGHKSGLNLPAGIVTGTFHLTGDPPSNEWGGCKHSCFIAQDRGVSTVLPSIRSLSSLALGHPQSLLPGILPPPGLLPLYLPCVLLRRLDHTGLLLHCAPRPMF